MYRDAIMTDEVWINKVAISSIDWLVDNPLSAPNQQLLPTCLAPHFMSLNRFLHSYKSRPGTWETHANQMWFPPQAAVIWYPPALSSLLWVSFILTWRLYTSHAFPSVSSGTTLFSPSSHCQQPLCKLHYYEENEKKGDMIEVITPTDNNNPFVVLFSTPPQAHQNCQKSLVTQCELPSYTSNRALWCVPLI